MKRSRTTVAGARRAKNRQGKSRYAAKRERNDMMYGPGCCAHSVSAAQITAARQRARGGVIVIDESSTMQQETV